MCLSLHQRAPKRNIKIITISTNKDKTATAGYINKNAIFRYRFHVCEVLDKMLVAAVILMAQTRVLACECRDTLLRGTDARIGCGCAVLRAQ